MCLSEGLLGVIIGFIGTFVIYLLTSRKEEKRWIEQRKIEKEKSTILYFRENYKALAPFLAISSQFDHILGGAVTLITEPPKEPQANQIKALLPKFLKGYEAFLAKGYAGLFPNDLGTNVLRYGEKLTLLNAELTKTPNVLDWNTKIFKLIVEIPVIGKQVRNRIRQLLNVEVLD